MQAAVQLLADYELPLAPVGLRTRIAFQTVMRRGLTVGEADPAGSAAREVDELWRAIAARLWGGSDG